MNEMFVRLERRALIKMSVLLTCMYKNIINYSNCSGESGSVIYPKSSS